MPQTTLLSSSEALYYVSHHYSLSASDVQKQIFLQERRAAQTVIGADFFALLLADAVDYSAVADWVPGTYNAGQFVRRQGLVYECTANGTTSDPNGGLGWQLAEKFTTACYNALWDNGLANFLSNIIFAASCNSIAYKVAPGGIVQINAQDAQQAAIQTAQTVATKYREDANSWWELASQYAIDNNETCNGAYNDFLPVKKHIACTANGQTAQLGRARNRYLFMGNNFNHPNNANW